MRQQTISNEEYSARKRKTRREEFLEIMDKIILREEWVSYIPPYYPSGKRGRLPKGIVKKLRVYLLQCWFNLSDEGGEDQFGSSLAPSLAGGVATKIGPQHFHLDSGQRFGYPLA